MQIINFKVEKLLDILYDSFLDREIGEEEVALILWGAGVRIANIEEILELLYEADRDFRAELKAEVREEFWGTNQEVYLCVKTRGEKK